MKDKSKTEVNENPNIILYRPNYEIEQNKKHEDTKIINNINLKIENNFYLQITEIYRDYLPHRINIYYNFYSIEEERKKEQGKEN